MRIYSQSRPELLTVRLGTLDDTSWLKPAGAIWMSSAQSWVVMPEGTLLYDEDGDWPAINAKWRAEWT